MREEKTKNVEIEAIFVIESHETSLRQVLDGQNSPAEKNLFPLPQDLSHSISKSPPIVEKVPDPIAERKSKEGIDRDILLARVETEKKLALIKAWEESEKAIAQNSRPRALLVKSRLLQLEEEAYKKLSTIKAWEDSKRACVEAQLKKIEEIFEKKKAKYAEKMNNKAVEIHRAAEERRVIVEAKLGEDIVKVEEIAERYRRTGNYPKRLFGCFRC